MKTDQKFEYIKGAVEKVVFHNAENGFSVVRVKVQNHRDLITVVGMAPKIYAGENVEVQGTWANDSKYGVQFKANFVRSASPNSADEMEKYLGSGLIKGVGPFFAKKLMSIFGENIFDVIEKNPEKLGKIGGIGEKRAKLISESWREQKSVKEIMMFLHTHDVSSTKAVRIYKMYGENAIKAVSENPYRLARDIWGIGFLSADKIARSLGIESNSIIRVRAGINYLLTESLNEGHCGLPLDLLVERGQALLSVERELLNTALKEEVLDKFLIKDSVASVEMVFLFSYFLYEKSIADKIKQLSANVPLYASIDVPRAISWVESGLAIQLARAQTEAIEAVLTRKVSVITGGPGTGKTTIINSIIRILKAKKVDVNLCAPTGRAAKRLSESTGTAACTIHRLLKYDPHKHRFSHNQENPLKCDVLIMDESSMVDVQLMYHLLKALPDHASLVLVGDIDQLPSVGPGQVLKDVIESKIVHTVRLNQIFRQGENSQIVENAHLVNQGLFPKFESNSGDFHFIEAQDAEEVLPKILRIITHDVPKIYNMNPVTDVQVLCPMQRGSCGAKSLNIELQKVLNPNTSEGIQRFGQTFALGDKVMQITNNYDKEVYNGDLGLIKEIHHEDRKLSVDFEGRLIGYSFDELDELSIAYATTIHKAQGSEYQAVIVPISTQHFPMLQKRLLYTAITRGKRHLFLVGQKKAIAMAISNKKELNRFSKLKEWLCH